MMLSLGANSHIKVPLLQSPTLIHLRSHDLLI
jgi:hypothetical protein